MEQRKIPAPYSACRPGSLRLEENLHFSLSAAGGTPVPSLPTVPNLKWWVICYGPKGSRKAWPNLTKPEGHKKDFEQNVSGLLALPIPSQLLRANNFHVMAVGERRGEKSEKSFWWKTASFGGKKKRQMNSTVFAQTRCVLGCLGLQDWPCSWPWAFQALGWGLCTFNTHPLLPALEGQLSTVPVPQNICQQLWPNFSKLGQRTFPLSTVATLPLLQPDVLEVKCRRSPGPSRWWCLQGGQGQFSQAKFGQPGFFHSLKSRRSFVSPCELC